MSDAVSLTSRQIYPVRLQGRTSCSIVGVQDQCSPAQVCA